MQKVAGSQQPVFGFVGKYKNKNIIISEGFSHKCRLPTAEMAGIMVENGRWLFDWSGFSGLPDV